jgi:hypothetical protein
MKLPTPPDGYRIMNKGEHPKEGDLCYSYISDPKWSRSSMTGKYEIREVPAIWPLESTLDPKIKMEYSLVWATKE